MKQFLDNLACKFMTAKANAKAVAAEKIDDAMTTPMKGATAMEYVLIVSIMAGVIIIAWRLLGNAIEDRMNEVDDEIRQGY